MRRHFTRLALTLLLLALPQAILADMGSYCSAPPYVSRSIAPNIMVLMDNSQDMLTSAYGDSYVPNLLMDNYIGYFKPTGCYAYSSNIFVEQLNSAVIPNRTFTASETCPSNAPFRGNLLNWATMSKYDILQKVLIGGNAVSKQGNAHTLLSISGTWAKAHSGCSFIVNGGNLRIGDVTLGSCSLIAATPSPIALSPLRTFWEMFSRGVTMFYSTISGGTRNLIAAVGRVWEEVDLVTKAWAAQLTLTIQSGTLNGTVGIPFSLSLEAGGDNNTDYYWSTSPSPPAPWLSGPTYFTSGQKGNYRATWSGTPAATGTYTFSVTLTDRDSNTPVTHSYTINVTAGALLINTPSLPDGEVGVAYPITLTGQGGIPPYTWSAFGLPLGLTIDTSTGAISGTPLASGTYNVVVYLFDSNGTMVSKSFSGVQIASATGLNSVNYSTRVQLIEESFSDFNGNGIWDPGEFIDSNSNGTKDVGEVSYVDSNGNGVWEGKQGIFQKFWDTLYPRARWGLTKFANVGGTATVDVDACIPASPASSFYTRIQNAIPVPSSPLSKGLYGDVNYYGFNSTNFSNYAAGSYNGCSAADPIDNIPCRKNFVLVITSGSDVTGNSFADTTDCANADPLVQNACFGYRNDLRSDKSGKQNVYTYVVNTMGTANNATLQAAATAGGGQYYDAGTAADLEQQLSNALTDILAQAASGTAVSVLTTSSRGIGSMVQAYFLPTKQEGTREVWWTGYTQNLWIDPKDNLREDTASPFQLNLENDKVVKLFFDQTTNETKVAKFSTSADGTGGSLAACTADEVEEFSGINYLWEAGKILAGKDPAARALLTATKVVKGASGTIHTISDNDFTVANVTGDATLSAALDPDATYTAEKIVRYVRGEDLESADLSFRDRRLDVEGTQQVWKLGDVISSTPKVFANTPTNTYHTDYGDSTYYSYFTSNAYKQRSSIAFVGANDGVLHAFRVGYLKDTGLTAPVKALFKNLFSSTDTTNDQLGDEVWGYIPFNGFPYLKYLANPGYCHIYFNDLSVRLVDASFGGVSNPNPSDTRSAASWRSILIGGMRFGGACENGFPNPPATVSNVGYSAYYAIDITDPENPQPLWEFSDPDLGYATSFPSIIRTGPTNQNGNWYVAVGSGSQQLPKANTDLSRTSTGYIYLLDLKTGAMIKKIDLGHNAIVGDILAIDAERDYQSEKIYFGTAHKPGTSWEGKLVGLSIPADLNGLCGIGVTRSAADCSTSLKTLFAGSFPFTASPDAVRDTSGNIWVYAGSGKYFSDVDEADSSNQVFMGVKDKPSGITYPLAIGDVTDRTSVSTTGTVTGTTTECAYDGSSNSFGMRTLVTSINPTSAAATDPTNGWYVSLTQGERVITRPMAVGGLVDFLTYKPSSDACAYGGDSYLYAVGYTTGVAPTNVAIRSPETTGGTTTGTVTVARGVLLGPGAPPTGEAIIIPPPKEGQETLKKKIQIATGVIVEAENAPVHSTISKIVHWLKK